MLPSLFRHSGTKPNIGSNLFNKMNKFNYNDTVRFLKDSEIAKNYPQDFKVVRYYQVKDDYKYDLNDMAGLNLILAIPENLLEAV